MPRRLLVERPVIRPIARDHRRQHFRPTVVRDEHGPSTSKQHHRSMAMMGSDLIVERPSLRIIDPSGLLKDIAAVDPFPIRPAGVFGNSCRRSQPVGDIAELEGLVVDENPVVGIDPSIDALPI